jgi:hypothetical protein
MKSVERFFVKALLLFDAVFAPQAVMAGNIEPYHAKTIDAYQAQTIEPVRTRTVTPDRSSVISVEGSSSQPHVFSDAERQEMHRNDVNAGRTHESMSRGKSGKVSNSQSRLNHYSNMQNLQRRMDQSGTTGYNPYRNE